MAAEQRDDISDRCDGRVEARSKVLMDDVAGRSRRNFAARLGIKYAAADRTFGQVVCLDLAAPAVKLAGDRKFSIVRWFIGPITSIAAFPHRSMFAFT